LLATCFRPVSFLAYSSTMKIEATCCSETSGYFQRTTRRYIPEDRSLYESRHCVIFQCFLLGSDTFSSDDDDDDDDDRNSIDSKMFLLHDPL
jgi:hypothetical protein